MRVKIDSQIFAYQINGGISTYFFNLLEQANNFQEGTMGISPSIFFSRSAKKDALYLPKTMHIPHNKFSALADSINCEMLRFDKIPDVYHSTYYSSKYLKWLKRAKHVVTIHDMIPEDYPEYFPNNPHGAKHAYIRAADHIVCVSEFTRSRLLHYFPDCSSKISVIHHGVDNFWRKTSENLTTNRRRTFRIAYIGRRDNYKNFEILIEAVGLLHERGIDVEVIVIGKSPWTSKEKWRIETLGISANFQQKRASDIEMRHELNRSDLFVSTSLSEGFGLPILEAMSSGLPTLLSDISVYREIASDSSLYFDPKSAADLADKIMNFVQDPKLLSKMRISGSNLSSQYTWKSTFDKTLQVYEKIM
jgi:glycosyltransferase involved in cell wall biosynthesis